MMPSTSRLFLAAAFAAASAAPLAAQGRPVQLALFSPVQVVPEDRAVTAVRLSVLYTRNAAVRLVDLGLGYNRTTGGHSEGIQWALVAWNDGSFSGWQSSAVSITKGKFVGLQQGFYSRAVNGEGLQWGLINTAEYWNGVQFGLVNYTQRMKGLQIGLVNVIRQGGAMPVLPIVNWSF